MREEPEGGAAKTGFEFDRIRRQVMEHARGETRANAYGGPEWERLSWEIALEVLSHAADYFWTTGDGKRGTILHEAHMILANGFDEEASELVHRPRRGVEGAG
jgi:hypothetical protein